MSRPGASWGAAVLFLIFVLLLLPLGFPPEGGRWEAKEASLAVIENTLGAGASLHLPVPSPPFPGPSSFCAQCHPLPPHPGSGVSPAFLNQHATTLDCLICHWPSAGGPRPGAVWAGARLRQPLAPESQATVEDPAPLRDKVIPRKPCFDRGPRCGTCHRPGGMAPFARPGQTPQAVAALESLPDFFTLSGSAKWYFPQRLQTVAP